MYKFDYEAISRYEEAKDIDIEQEVGKPALYGMLAEECCELSQAALKMQRKICATVPVSKSIYECIDSMDEEVADVLNSLRLLGYDVIIKDRHDIDQISDYKIKRCKCRILEEKEFIEDVK